jgi:hypothetical protein
MDNAGLPGDIVLHPANRAAHLYQSGTSDSPRRVDQFFLVFNLYPIDDDFLSSKLKYINTFRDRLHFLCHTVEGPKFQIQQDVMNQYNRKRIINRKLDFDPMTVRMYDTIDGLGLRFIKLLYEFEFQGARLYKEREGGEHSPGRGASAGKLQNSEVGNYAESVLNPETHFANTHNFGLIPKRGHQHRLVKSIDFYQLAGKLYSKARMIHPRLSRFDMDQYDYSSSAVANLSMAFQYENLVFEEVAVRTEDADLNKVNGTDIDKSFSETTNAYNDSVLPSTLPRFKDSQLPPQENKRRPEKDTAVVTEVRGNPDKVLNEMMNANKGEFTGTAFSETGGGGGVYQEQANEFMLTKSVIDKFKIPSDGEYDQANSTGYVFAGKGYNPTNDYVASNAALRKYIDEQSTNKTLTSTQLEQTKKEIIAEGPTGMDYTSKRQYEEQIARIDQAIKNKKTAEDNNITGNWPDTELI